MTECYCDKEYNAVLSVRTVKDGIITQQNIVHSTQNIIERPISNDLFFPNPSAFITKCVES